MKKHALLGLLLCVCLLTAGCGGEKAAPAAEATPLPTAPPAQAPAVTAQGKLAQTARALMAPYQDEIIVAAAGSPAVLTYAIPGDLINQMAQDAREVGAEAQEGRYRFTWRSSGRHTYTASAMQIEQIEEAAETTPDPMAAREPVMDNQLMGDFSATGGGTFERARAYDAAEDLSEGRAEITETLNGALSLHELFSFAREGGCLYFVDAALDQAVDIDGLVATSRYLVAAGVLRRDGLDIIEFIVPDEAQVPAASAAAWGQILSSYTPLTRLTVEGARVQVTP